MRRAWSWWVARTSRTEDARPLALVRIGVSLAILLDLLEVARLGLVGVLFRPSEAGGLSQVQDEQAWIDAWPAHGGLVAWWVSVVAMAMSALGVATRPAMLAGTLAYAQLGHLYPPGDRAIDRLLRTVLLVLLFSGAHRRFVLAGPRVDRIGAWAGDTIRLLLVILYMAAGLGKLQQQPDWLAFGGTPVLYRVMTDPLAAHVDPVAALPWWPLLQALGWGTIALELSSPLILTRWRRVWALGGIGMHGGIAMTMDLGMFSWGMLALYPVLLAREPRSAEVSRTPRP